MTDIKHLQTTYDMFFNKHLKSASTSDMLSDDNPEVDFNSKLEIISRLESLKENDPHGEALNLISQVKNISEAELQDAFANIYKYLQVKDAAWLKSPQKEPDFKCQCGYFCDFCIRNKMRRIFLCFKNDSSICLRLKNVKI